MKWWIIGALVVVVGAGLIKTMQAGGGYERLPLTVDQLQAEGALVVDIRAPSEWQQTGVIKGAKLVTFSDPASFLAAIGGDLKPGQPLALVCHSGRRSAAAAAALVGKVSNRIISVDGGMSRLMAEGYKTVAPK